MPHYYSNRPKYHMCCNFHVYAAILNNQCQITCGDIHVTMNNIAFAVAVAAVQQIVTAVYALLFDTPTLHEKRVTKKRKREGTSYKKMFLLGMAIQQQCSSQSSPYKKSCWIKIIHICTNLPTMLGIFSFLVKCWVLLCWTIEAPVLLQGSTISWGNIFLGLDAMKSKTLWCIGLKRQLSNCLLNPSIHLHKMRLKGG